MLLQLNIQNFAIVKSLDIDWHSGMTTITGETGAETSTQCAIVAGAVRRADFATGQVHRA